MSPDESQSFPASYDSTAKIISAVVFVILAVVVIATQSILVGGLGAVLLILPYAYSPRKYAISERSIIVKRLIGNVRIPLKNVREVRPATHDDFRGCVRLFGNGGLFGYYGTFSTSKLGNCTWYMTNRRNAVIVGTAEKTVLFSPDDVLAFLDAIRRVVAVPEAPVGQFAGMESRPTKVQISAWVGGGIGVLAVAFAVSALMYAPGPPSYTLTPTSLTIHDRFYPVTLNAASVDVEQICVVDFGVQTDWRPTARTNGFANSHYHSGWFRVTNGQKVRMYWADSKRLVLLPVKGDGAPVLLETKDPEAFVREVRREWSDRL